MFHSPNCLNMVQQSFFEGVLHILSHLIAIDFLIVHHCLLCHHVPIPEIHAHAIQEEFHYTNKGQASHTM